CRRVSQSGRYISPPGSGGEAKEVVLNNPLSLYCETNAVPRPPSPGTRRAAAGVQSTECSILPGARVLQIPRAQADDSGRTASQSVSEGRYRLLPNGARTLQVLNAQVSDTGPYVCVADNVAGSAEKSFNVQRSILPPSIVGPSPETQMVVVNHFISLTCEASGFPPPSLRWLRGRGPVEPHSNAVIMPGGRTLQILRARESDGGSPSQYPGPEWGVPVVVSVRLGKAVTLECESNAVPPPTITWYKNGRAVSETAHLQLRARGQRLEIRGAEVSDTGQYVCKASNVAGQVDKNFHLNIYIPPSIDGPPEEHVWDPPPSLTWLKDGRTLETSESLEMHILSGGSRLQIARSQPADGGRYTCVASNLEGEARKSYQLVIQGESYHLVIQGESYHLVIQGESYQLVIQGESYQLVIQGESYHLVIQGESYHLVIQGESYHLVIQGESYHLVIQGESYQLVIQGESYHLVIQGESYQLLIQGESYHLVIQGESYHLVIQGESYHLVIQGESYQLVIQGESYQLVIQGESYQLVIQGESYHLVIQGESYHLVIQGESYQLLIQGESYQLLIQGESYQLLIQGESYHLVIQGESYQLLIQGESYHLVIQGESYHLVIQGESYQLLIQGESYHLVIQGVSYQLLIQGESYHLVIQGESYHLVIQGESYHLVIQGESYHLVIQGESYQLLIQGNQDPPLPPSPSQYLRLGDASDVGVLLNQSVQLQCLAEGSPPPTVQWLKDGERLNGTGGGANGTGGWRQQTQQQPGRRRAHRGRGAPLRQRQVHLRGHQQRRGGRPHLQPQRVRAPHHRGDQWSPPQGLTAVLHGAVTMRRSGSPAPRCPTRLYTCVASNRGRGGEQTLQPAVPPRLDRAGSTEDVTVGRPGAGPRPGAPPPPLNTTLELPRAAPNHTARYTCRADSVAGQASRHFNLRVLEPPSINGSQDGRPLPQTDRVRLLRGGEGLVVASAQVEDTGRYTCLANSPAGDDDKEFLVRVHVPPNIAGEGAPQDVAVLRGRQVTLECQSDAVPPPTLTWLKDGSPLQASGRVRLLSQSRYLQINTAELGDHAHYTCVATNVAGETTRQFNLTVNVAPSIQPGPQSVAVLLAQPAVLGCVVEGVPPPRVTWRKHGAVLDGDHPRYTVTEERSLLLHGAQVTDTGSYLCMATTPGREPIRGGWTCSAAFCRRRALRPHGDGVNVQTTLACEATGIPSPALLSSGSLVVMAPRVEDTATYECLASNEAGEDSRTVNLTVQVPPSLADEPSELEVLRLAPRGPGLLCVRSPGAGRHLEPGRSGAVQSGS
ncbi:unnamed protein product, partial [Gadus morhua 'NCC']